MAAHRLPQPPAGIEIGCDRIPPQVAIELVEIRPQILDLAAAELDVLVAEPSADLAPMPGFDMCSSVSPTSAARASSRHGAPRERPQAIHRDARGQQAHFLPHAASTEVHATPAEKYRLSGRR